MRNITRHAASKKRSILWQNQIQQANQSRKQRAAIAAKRKNRNNPPNPKQRIAVAIRVLIANKLKIDAILRKTRTFCVSFFFR